MMMFPIDMDANKIQLAIEQTKFARVEPLEHVFILREFTLQLFESK